MLTGNHYWACLRQSFFGYKWFWKSVCYQSLHKMADAVSRDIAVLPSFKLSGPVLQALVALKEYRDAAVELRGLVKDPQQVNLPTYEVHVHTYRWLSARLQLFQCVSNRVTAVLHKTIDVKFIKHDTPCQWLSARLRQLQCVSTGVAPVLHLHVVMVTTDGTGCCRYENTLWWSQWWQKSSP